MFFRLRINISESGLGYGNAHTRFDYVFRTLELGLKRLRIGFFFLDFYVLILLMLKSARP